MTDGKVTISYRTCTCGKRGYLTRADAKRVIKVMLGRGARRGVPNSRLSLYRCVTAPELFHIGHATATLVELQRTRGDPS